MSLRTFSVAVAVKPTNGTFKRTLRSLSNCLYSTLQRRKASFFRQQVKRKREKRYYNSYDLSSKQIPSISQQNLSLLEVLLRQPCLMRHHPRETSRFQKMFQISRTSSTLLHCTVHPFVRARLHVVTVNIPILLHSTLESRSILEN